MKISYFSVVTLCCIFVIHVMSMQVAGATVPMVEITIAGGANTQNCTSCFVPQNTTVSRGTAIEWINKDLVPHIIVSGKPGDLDNGTLFNTGMIPVGKFFIQNFNDVGVFPYFDKKYPWDKRIITVIDSNNLSTDLKCIDNITQDEKTKYASFDEEQAKTAAVNYDKFKSEVKDDKYVFRAVSQEWTNDQANCTATLKNVRVLFFVTDSSGKQRDVIVIVDPTSYAPQDISVEYDVATHGGVESIIANQDPEFNLLDHESPLKQFKSGIASKDVKCHDGLGLIFKKEDGSPSCVRPETMGKLIERGWGFILSGLPTSPGLSTSPLNLYLSTNSTFMQSGQAIGIDISLNNTSSQQLTLPVQDNWPINGLGSGGCSFLPIGIAILDGYYTEQNMTDKRLLSFYFQPPCAPFNVSLKNYTFQPMSSNVIIKCESPDSNIFSCPHVMEMKYNVAYNNVLENGDFHYFKPGLYTIVGGDEWGHIAVQHFVVTNSTKH